MTTAIFAPTGAGTAQQQPYGGWGVTPFGAQIGAGVGQFAGPQPFGQFPQYAVLQQLEQLHTILQQHPVLQQLQQLQQQLQQVLAQHPVLQQVLQQVQQQVQQQQQMYPLFMQQHPAVQVLAQLRQILQQQPQLQQILQQFPLLQQIVQQQVQQVLQQLQPIQPAGAFGISPFQPAGFGIGQMPTAGIGGIAPQLGAPQLGRELVGAMG